MSVNALTSAGLTVQGVNDIVAQLSAGLATIYGADINLGPNTSDGQMVNIYATALEDNLELLSQVYNSFSIVNAYGVQVDNLVALNGIQRQPGTNTTAYVTVTTSQALNLTGQDALASNPSAQVFTVADVSGNQYQLITSYSFGSAGNASLAFQCTTVGEITTTPNTITTIATPVLGVTSVNNPSTSSDIIGVNEESDIQLKVRQAKSLGIGSVGAADAIRAQLLNISGVVDAFVPENDAASIVNGVFANGIQVIVNAPSTLNAQIAQVIYEKKTIGCAQTSPFTLSGTTSSGAATVTFASTLNMANGQSISGTGIPSGTTISSVNSSTQITMSANATASGSVSITITPPGTIYSYNITRPAGNIFTAYWFAAQQEPLYISFTIQPINGVDTFNATTLAQSLAAALDYTLNQSAFVGQIINAMQTIAPNGYLTSVAVGNAASPTGQFLAPSDYQHYFTVSASNITITT